MENGRSQQPPNRGIFAKVDEWNSYGTNSSMDETATIIIGKLIDVAGNRYTHTTASVHAFRPVLPSGEKKVKGPVNRIWSSRVSANLTHGCLFDQRSWMPVFQCAFLVSNVEGFLWIIRSNWISKFLRRIDFWLVSWYGIQICYRKILVFQYSIVYPFYNLKNFNMYDGMM